MKIVKTWIANDGFAAKLNDGNKNIFIIYSEEHKTYKRFKFIEFEKFTKEIISDIELDNKTFDILEVRRNFIENMLTFW